MANAKNLFTDWWYNTDELQAESDRLDAERAAQNAATASRIATNQGQAASDLWQRHVDVNTARGTLNASAEVGDAFNEGLSEGYDNVTGGIRAAVNFPLKFIWDALPWWVWVGGAGALFWYLGGAVWIRRKVSGS
jgi:hypothetical protein